MDDGAAAVHGYGARLLRPLIAHVSCSCSAALCLVIRSSLRPVVCPSVCVNEMMERGVRCVCAPWSGFVRDQLGRADGHSFGLFLSPAYHLWTTRCGCGRTGFDLILWTIGPDTNDVRASQRGLIFCASEHSALSFCLREMTGSGLLQSLNSLLRGFRCFVSRSATELRS